LPGYLSTDTVANGGSSVLDAYAAAIAAVARISRIDTWLAGLTDLPVYVNYAPDPVLRVLTPITKYSPGNLDKIEKAQRGAASVEDMWVQNLCNEPYLRPLVPLYVVAVRNRIPFGMKSPSEAAELRNSLEPSYIGAPALAIGTGSAHVDYPIPAPLIF
jgi:hypothetical protein